jgi:hypothetical protein
LEIREWGAVEGRRSPETAGEGWGGEVGVLLSAGTSRAAELYGVGFCGYAFASSHYHLLLLVDTAKQLADFMGYFNSNLAREAGRLVHWREKFWSRRYRAIVVRGEEGAQRERLKYVLATAPGNINSSTYCHRARCRLYLSALTSIRQNLDHLSSGGIIPREARRQRQRGQEAANSVLEGSMFTSGAGCASVVPLLSIRPASDPYNRRFRRLGRRRHGPNFDGFS